MTAAEDDSILCEPASKINTARALNRWWLMPLLPRTATGLPPLAQRGMINHLPDKVMDCSPRSCEYANGGHTRFDRPDMRIERHGRRLPYSSEQIFDLAADIERYPQFLRWWISAHIVRREPQLLTVEQVLGVGPVQMRFTSQALLQRPDCLEVRSSDSMFEKFHMRFLVSPQGPMAARSASPRNSNCAP